MFIWIFFSCWIVFLSFLIELKTTRPASKKLLFALVVFSLVYFSAFRDGLGEDFNNYKSVISDNERTYSFSEPIYTAMVDLTNSFGFSEVFFFLFFSCATIIPAALAYKRSRSFGLSVVVFIFLPVLYFNTFNIVRQYAAAAILLYSTRWIADKSRINFVLGVLIAAMIHASAIFVAPFLLLANYAFARKWVLIALISSYVLGSVYTIDLSSLNFAFMYKDYVVVDEKSLGGGMLTIVLNVLTVYVNHVRKRLSPTPQENIYFNMLVMCVVLYNFIPSLLYLYRFAIYFMMSLPIVLALPVRKGSAGAVYKASIFALFVAIFCFFLVSAENNPKIIPSALRTPDEILK